MNLRMVAKLVEKHVVLAQHGGGLQCLECGSFCPVGETLEHDSGCRYVEAVKLLGRIDPPIKRE